MLKNLFFLSVLLITACTMGGNTKQPQLADTYQDNAILMRIEASKDLNLYNDQKHTLKLVIIQVEKVEDVQKQLMSADSIAKLLDSADDSVNSDSKPDSNKKYICRPCLLHPVPRRYSPSPGWPVQDGLL